MASGHNAKGSGRIGDKIPNYNEHGISDKNYMKMVATGHTVVDAHLATMRTLGNQ